ncbi:MAG: helicase-exonuclease AddAB subunit AddA [Tyzzerella sp.]|nr:helicase-exonuclease AddAB subunit AddA [Tyzzerella sp.]
MGVVFTKEQQQVIDLRGRNILVSAAAGSGKTAVLVERIIARLTRDEHPIDIDELLIVTYTEAAAAEMKERIQSAIEKALEEDTENLHLQRQATLIHQAQITTIHGFCLSVIRDYFHTIDLDPGFRIAEEGELKLLKRDVAEELIERYYAEGRPEFLEFVESYASGKDDRKLEEILLQVYEFSRSYPNPERWLESCVEQYQVSSISELEEKPFVQDIMVEIKRCLRGWQEELEFGISICDSEDGPAAYRDTLYADQAMLSRLENISSFQKMQEYFGGLKWARIATNRDKTVSEDKIALVKNLRDKIKESAKKMAEQFFFSDVEEMYLDMLAAKSNMQVLANLVKEFANAFTEKKRSKNLLDFGDMERYALQILTREVDGEFLPSAVAEELQEKFDEVMIDEYQDSNLVQEAILTSVSKVSKGIYNIFMVGDVKQSIYRFRLSRPELFMEKFHTYSLEDGEKQRIDLHKNFRSRAEVLESTNFVFGQIMTDAFGGIEYDDKAALYVGASYEEMPGNETEVLLIDTGDLQKQESKEFEARAVARRIKELVGSHKILDKKTGEYREARFSDIVVLTRSLMGWTDVFSQVLNQEGIPTYTSSREGYFQTREIQLLLDYLRVLDNPKQDIPFAAVLVSMFAEVTNEELALIKSSTNEKTLYESVCTYLEQGEIHILKHKLRHFIEQFTRFRERVPYTAIHVLLWQILEETGYKDYAAALPGGAQRAANLEMLLEKAITFESTSYKGLFNFVRYMEQLHKYDVDYGEATIMDENMDVVNLMSIHKSKGLEFPIVFVSGIGKGFNTQDAKGSIVVHPELGVGLDAIDTVRRTKAPTLLKRMIQKRIVLEGTAEELRVLYVAMTRAKEKMILTGTVKNLGDGLNRFMKLERREETHLSYVDLTKANKYLDWILPALYRNQCFAPVLAACGAAAPFYNSMFRREVPIIAKLLDVKELVNAETENEFQDHVVKNILKSWDVSKVYDTEIKKQIATQFAYRYSYGDSQKIKQKMSVSELKKRIFMEEEGEEAFKEEEVIPLLPKFVQEKEELTGASRGTAYHRFLELLDFSKTYHEEELQKVLQEKVAERLIDEDMAECIRISDILTFLQSNAGKRMQKASDAEKLHAEQPFVLGLPAKNVYSGETSEEIVLIQGIIDVYFEEDGELVILDYKTDKVFRAEELVEKYHAQLDYYAEALERLTGKRVKEKIIYSFTLQKEIEV